MIWNELKKPFLILAPMEGVTDIAFRQVVARAGRPDLFFTEFTNVSSYASEKGRAKSGLHTVLLRGRASGPPAQHRLCGIIENESAYFCEESP